ncbi:MAG: protein translocase subunit SecD, partial [Patescibacteria group bacterium]
MAKYRFWAVILVFASAVAGYWLWGSQKSGENKFKLGLDLSGGTHLVYKADTSKVIDGDISGAMNSLRDTIERRVNLFGVSEPLVQVEKSGIGGVGENRLIVELPGVTDVNEAIRQIGKTPSLEFKLLQKGVDLGSLSGTDTKPNDVFIETGLNGTMLSKAVVQFDPNFPTKALVGLNFNDQGKELFAKITKEHVGEVMGIFLDGQLVEAPSIREEITGGQAVITGDFTPEQARQVVRDLNYGALPLPVELISTQSIGASLGERAVAASLKAGRYAFIIVALFLIAWYRFSGAVAVLALVIYTVIN